VGYRAALLNFSKGEISPELQSRFDISAYQVGLRRARNVKIRRTGGVSKRMGTRFVAEALSSTARLFPFQFNDEQAYALEFGQAYMRPLALGGAVLEEYLAVSAITKAANARITSAYHGYSVGDQVYLSGITGMVEINDRFLTVVSVIDANNFTVDIDSTGFGTFTGSGGGTVRTGDPAPPPAAPPVPAPLPDPTPPPVGSGSGGTYAGGGSGPSNGTSGIWGGILGSIP
jgi:hypothetical protein